MMRRGSLVREFQTQAWVAQSSLSRWPVMHDLDLNSSVPEWLMAHPLLLKLFEELRIDYCCGGKSLEYACRERRIDPDELLAELHRLINGGESRPA